MNQKMKSFLGLLAGSALLTGLDQWTKLLVVNHLKGQSPIVIWDGVFELLYSENRGAAFGMLQGKQSFFLIVASCVFAAVVYAFWKMPANRRYVPLQVCLTFITAGAVGNMIDRVVQGYVVDFLYFKLIDFPIFNVADCYVTVATAILFILMMWYYTDEELDVFSFRRKEQV